MNAEKKDKEKKEYVKPEVRSLGKVKEATLSFTLQLPA